MKKPLIIMLIAIMLLAVSGCNSNVHKVEKMINNIGEIEPTLKCKNTLDKVSAAYNALSDEQKEQVSNANDLTSATLSFEGKEILQGIIIHNTDGLKADADLCSSILSLREFTTGGFIQSDFADGIEVLKTGHQSTVDIFSKLEENSSYIKIEGEQKVMYDLLQDTFEKYKPLYELTLNPPSSYDEYSAEFTRKKVFFDIAYETLEETVSPIRAQYEELNATNQTTN